MRFMSVLRHFLMDVFDGFARCNATFMHLYIAVCNIYTFMGSPRLFSYFKTLANRVVRSQKSFFLESWWFLARAMASCLRGTGIESNREFGFEFGRW